MLRIVEVGPRDGLQNESVAISIDAKSAFIQSLALAGLKEIEATSFVSPKWVPQLGDAAELWPKLAGAQFSALVPNLKGLERALEVGVQRIAVFTAASDAFTLKNINMTVDQSLEAFREVVERFREARPAGWVRGYVSTAFECPFAGRVDPAETVDVARRLLELGCDEISLGDTIGVAVPREVRTLTKLVIGEIPIERLNYHFHDTRGTAIANVAEAYEFGVTSFDASAGGLGGCPYAPGAGGNLATDDLVYFFERNGVPTDVDPIRLAQASLPVLAALGRRPAAKAQQAVLAALPPTQ
ncbi:MAG: hydroxymethylglutaryl-CoA lyase [Fimbriimonadales bacterium]